ncbi:Alpha/Beta hydrolase protein [Hypoxylon argillaceum]|nr:Alpha/Beta hydrolase protein [Hypoxylon argillaceum]
MATPTTQEMTTKTDVFQVTPSRVLSYAITSPSPPPPAGATHRPFVLLSSALSAPFTIWDPVVPHLLRLGFDVLRHDAPGHGRSGLPANLCSTTFESLAADVHALLAHLRIARLHAWVGVSLGAATAIVFAALYPGVVERLVPCDTLSRSPVNAGTQDGFGARVATAREDGNMRTSIEVTLERWCGRAWLDSHHDEAERARGVMRGTSVDGFDTCCWALRSSSFDLRPLAARAGAHVEAAMLLVGEKDVGLFQTMEELRRGIETGLRSRKGQNAAVALKIVRNGGHVCFIDGFASFIDLFTTFLTSTST